MFGFAFTHFFVVCTVLPVLFCFASQSFLFPWCIVFYTTKIHTLQFHCAFFEWLLLTHGHAHYHYCWFGMCVCDCRCEWNGCKIFSYGSRFNSIWFLYIFVVAAVDSSSVNDLQYIANINRSTHTHTSHHIAMHTTVYMCVYKSIYIWLHFPFKYVHVSRRKFISVLIHGLHSEWNLWS